MRVAVFGPNLRDQTRGDFHVHKADCKDADRRVGRGEYSHADFHGISANSKRDVITTVYDPNDFQYDPDDPKQIAVYEHSFYFFPCCQGLTDDHGV